MLTVRFIGADAPLPDSFRSPQYIEDREIWRWYQRGLLSRPEWRRLSALDYYRQAYASNSLSITEVNSEVKRRAKCDICHAWVPIHTHKYWTAFNGQAWHAVFCPACKAQVAAVRDGSLTDDLLAIARGTDDEFIRVVYQRCAGIAQLEQSAEFGSADWFSSLPEIEF
jgi:hypothetical protein